MKISKKLMVAAAAVALGAGLGLSLASSTAGATTGTCLGTQNPVSGPVSCGGLFMPGFGSGNQPNSSSLTLTAASDFWNAPITFAPYDSSSSAQDFTVYEVCSSVGGTPTEANPCGSGHPVLNAASGRAEFVAEVTPLGKHLGTGINDINNLCISENAVHDGPLSHGHRALRWHMVERTCDTYGATFTAGILDGPTGTGIPGTVVNPNPWQTFAAVPGSGGDLIANDILSHNFKNTLYVVDDRAGGYPNGNAIVFPENDQRNQIAKFIGCNGAVLTTGVSFTCP